MITDTVDKLLLTIPEVAHATGYSRSYIYEYIAAGKLKVKRKGRTVRVSTEDLQAWINEED